MWNPNRKTGFFSKCCNGDIILQEVQQIEICSECHKKLDDNQIIEKW